MTNNNAPSKDLLNIFKQALISLPNDVYGNPRYYISFLKIGEVLAQHFAGIKQYPIEWANWAYCNRRTLRVPLYRGKKFGTGYVVCSYCVEHWIVSTLESASKILAKEQGGK